MEELKIFSENGSLIDVNCIYYYSNSNYYFIYTTKEIDENGYVVLYIVKIVREAVQNPSDSGLVGIKVTDEEEWKNVQADVSKILEDKKNKTNTAVHYLDSKNLVNLKIRDSRIFRLRPDIMKDSFEIDLELFDKEEIDNLDNQGFMDYKTKYLEQLNKVKELEIEISDYKQKISNIKNILE